MLLCEATLISVTVWLHTRADSMCLPCIQTQAANSVMGKNWRKSSLLITVLVHNWLIPSELVNKFYGNTKTEKLPKDLLVSLVRDVRSKHNKTGSPSWKNGQHQTSETRPQLPTLEEEEIVDTLGNDSNSSMPEQVSRPNPWRKMMMTMMNY